MFATYEVCRARKTFSALRKIVEVADGAGENAMYGEQSTKDAKATKADVWTGFSIPSNRGY